MSIGTVSTWGCLQDGDVHCSAHRERHAPLYIRGPARPRVAQPVHWTCIAQPNLARDMHAALSTPCARVPICRSYIPPLKIFEHTLLTIVLFPVTSPSCCIQSYDLKYLTVLWVALSCVSTESWSVVHTCLTNRQAVMDTNDRRYWQPKTFQKPCNLPEFPTSEFALMCALFFLCVC